VLWSNGLFLCSYSWGFLLSFCFNIRDHNKGGNYERESVFFFLFFFFSPQFCGFSPNKFLKKLNKNPFFVTFTLKGKKISNFFSHQVAKIKEPTTFAKGFSEK